MIGISLRVGRAVITTETKRIGAVAFNLAADGGRMDVQLRGNETLRVTGPEQGL